MFLQMLSSDEQELFLQVAWLICISDDPLLWDGKTESEITGETDLSEISIQYEKSEQAIMESLVRECSDARYWEEDGSEREAIEESLTDRLKSLPITKQNDPEQRQKIAVEILSGYFKKKIKQSSPASPKIMLYELLLLAMADGEISSVEGALIEQFITIQKIDVGTYEDVLERVQCMNREVAKTLSLILE